MVMYLTPASALSLTEQPYVGHVACTEKVLGVYDATLSTNYLASVDVVVRVEMFGNFTIRCVVHRYLVFFHSI
jgi:hypothetical protein